MIKINYSDLDKNYFPNNEFKFIMPYREWWKDEEVYTIEWIFENNEEIFLIQMLKKYLDDKNIKCELNVPFLPYGQQDRPIKDQLFSFKYFAQIINDMKFTKVSFCDPHSLVMQACINNAEVYYLKPLKDYDLVFYPDNGACKKYSEIYDFPYRYGNKKRNLDTGEIIKYEVIGERSDFEGKYILIIDDLCMGGRTFKEASLALYKMGARCIDLQIAHFMPNSVDFLKHHKEYGIKSIYTHIGGISSIPLSLLDDKEKVNIGSACIL